MSRPTHGVPPEHSSSIDEARLDEARLDEARLDEARLDGNRPEADRVKADSSATGFFPNLLSTGAVRTLLQQAPHTLARPPHLLQPEIESVYACGYYVSVQSPEAWSDLVRQAKHPPATESERGRLLSLVCDVFCDFIETQNPHLGAVDAVVAIPANPARLALRGMSLPDELGRAVQDRFGLPFLSGTLRSLAAPELQMRGLEFERRPLAVKGSMAFGQSADVEGRTLLLVDDVVCSGSTLREAARLLLGSGATRIYGACLATCLTNPEF